MVCKTTPSTFIFIFISNLTFIKCVALLYIYKGNNKITELRTIL